jgi:hypothetical protein
VQLIKGKHLLGVELGLSKLEHRSLSVVADTGSPELGSSPLAVEDLGS